MNVEASLQGLSDWHFPSPTSTPRSSGPEQAPVQTPKCEPSSHFLDAFYTPRATGQQTPAATPVTTQNEITARTPISTVTSPLTPQDPQFHVNHYKNGQLPLPPVVESQRLPSTAQPLQSAEIRRRSIIVPKTRIKGSMDGFNLQTPPPTRDSRRDYALMPSDVGSTPRQMYPPNVMQTPIRQAQQAAPPNAQFQTPAQLTPLQFSPAMFQIPSAPMSAPAMPHQRFSWDAQSPSFSFANEAMMSSQNDAFGPPHPVSPGFAQWQTPNMAVPPPQASFPASFSQPTQAGADFWTTPAISSQPTPSFDATSSFASTITTTGVDPSMIFSFTSPPRETNTSPIRPHITPQKIDTANRQPYEHQMRESNREKELARKARQASHSRTSTNSASITAGRPVLQRSNTDSSLRRPKLGVGENNRTAQILEQVERRPSPLKRHSQISLSAIPEAGRPRPKTRLVIGEDGRARTETIDNGADDSRHGFDIWDETSSDEELVSNSQRNSLQRVPSRNGRNSSDQDRFDPNKRPVSSASISSLASRLETTPIGKRSSRDLNYRRFSSGSFSGSLSNNRLSPNKDDEMDEDSDAQAALKKLVGNRASRRDMTNPQAILDAHNQRWSQASIDIAKFQAVQEQQNSYDPFASAGTSSLSPTSGTDPDILTPSTEHSTRSNESTRCICNLVDVPDQMMIQCESCNKWLHMRCNGLDPQDPPLVYVCQFCTGTTPLARGGRIREPIRRQAAAAPPPAPYASPLGYKSGMNSGINPFRR